MTSTFGVSEIEERIPHRFPMRQIDEITITDDGNIKAKERKFSPVTIFDSICGHLFNDWNRELAFALMIETCAQSAAVVALENKSDSIVLFQAINNLVIRDGALEGNSDKVEYITRINPDEKNASIEVRDEKGIYLIGDISCKIVSKRLLDRIVKGIKEKKAPFNKSKRSSFSYFDWFGNMEVKVFKGDISSKLFLDEDACIVDGHFPGQPIMPGVFILLGAIKTVERATGGSVNIVKNFDFLAPIIPPSILKIKTLNKKVKKEIRTLDIEVSANGLLSAKGTLVFKRPKRDE